MATESTSLGRVTADRVFISELSQHVGQEVTVKGWLYNLRSSGKILFPQLRDGTGVVQCVALKNSVTPEVWDALKGLGQESALSIRGTVRADSRAPGGFEIDLLDAEVIDEVHDYPITPKEHGTEFLMDHRHLWLRSRRQHAILKVRHTVVKAVRDFLENDGFTLGDSPIFTPAACEGTTTLFEVDYFDGEKAYLTQSGQLYNEATAAALGKAYCFGPTFRAEKSKTRRHLAEFWMVEPEVAFLDLEGDMRLAEDFISFVVARALTDRAEELKVLERDTSGLDRVKPPFPRITYAEAIDTLQKNGHPEAKIGDDFGGDEETVISAKFDRPVIVHRYPIDLKAFYFKHDPNDAGLALNMDVLAPEGYGEIIRGGQREDDLAELEAAIHAHK